MFNALGTTRAKAGGAAAFQDVEVGLTERLVRLAERAGVSCASVVSAQGANADRWVDPWELAHPLLYQRTLGRKEGAMERFRHLSVFRPGVLNRLMGDRPHEVLMNAVGLGLRVDHLAAAMVLDAEAMVMEARRAAAAEAAEASAAAGVPTENDAQPPQAADARPEVPEDASGEGVASRRVYYEGNWMIEHWAEWAHWHDGEVPAARVEL